MRIEMTLVSRHDGLPRLDMRYMALKTRMCLIDNEFTEFVIRFHTLFLNFYFKRVDQLNNHMSSVFLFGDLFAIQSDGAIKSCPKKRIVAEMS